MKENTGKEKKKKKLKKLNLYKLGVVIYLMGKIKLNHKCKLCGKEIYVKEEIVNVDSGTYHFKCFMNNMRGVQK